MSTGTSLGIIAVCQLIATIAIIVAAAGLVVAIILFKRMISSKIDEMMNRVQPILDQTKEIAQQAKETAEMVSEKVDSIMTRADNTAEKVSSRMDSVTAKVEEAVSPQAATFAGYAAAALKALQLFQQIAAVKQGPKSDK
jgi:predicted RNA-binding protein Jag